jgi:putative SOS response-associated peptidase YedK
MCGRYIQSTPLTVLQALYGATAVPEDAPPPRWNIAPSSLVPGLANDPSRRIELFRWGLVPSWAKDPAIGNRLINARAETLAEKPSFRDAFRRRRCLVFADGFYEWTVRAGRKVPILFRARDGSPLAFAGLWEEARPGDHAGIPRRTCALVTTAAGAPVAGFHDRMPVLLDGAGAALWLDPAPAAPAALAPLLRACPGDLLEAAEASPRVNNPGNEGPSLAVPVPSPGAPGDAAPGGGRE